MQDQYEVVVVGTGFGGSVVACRLAEAGHSVCVFERGRRYGKGDFPRTPTDFRRALWDGQHHGLVDYRSYRGMDVVAASGVGGGSLIYANVLVEAPQEAFGEGWPRGVGLAALEPYYDRAKKMLGANPLPQRLSQPKTEAFKAAARRLSRFNEWGRVNLAVYFGEKDGETRENEYGVTQTSCIHCGACVIGCNIHAKNTLDLNYVQQAQNHGAEVWPLHEVYKIEPTAVGYRVHFNDLTDGGQGSVTGKKVIVSAGTLGSTELLLSCREVHKTLPQLSRVLGKHFSGNGDFLGAAFYCKDATEPSEGPTITSWIPFWDKGFVVEEAGFPIMASWYLQGAIPTPGYVARVVRFLRNYVFRWLGFKTHSRIAADIAGVLQGTGIVSHALMLLVVGRDASDGIMQVDSQGRLRVLWDNRRSMPLFNNIVRTLREVTRALGGRFVVNPTWRWPMRKPTTVHPLGGCVLGDDRDTGVVNQWGEVFGYPNLFVADGSIIPRALGTNPSLTITALAERIAEHISNDW